MYELPEENSAVIGTALSGQALNICGQTADGWYETVFGNGIGYIRSDGAAEIAVDDGMAALVRNGIRERHRLYQERWSGRNRGR